MRHFRARQVAGFNAQWKEPGLNDGRYAVFHADRQLMRGRTFSREAADDICEALEASFEAGAEMGVKA